jgi:hypothetical protein
MLKKLGIATMALAGMTLLGRFKADARVHVGFGIGVGPPFYAAPYYYYDPYFYPYRYADPYLYPYGGIYYGGHHWHHYRR